MTFQAATSLKGIKGGTCRPEGRDSIGNNHFQPAPYQREAPGRSASGCRNFWFQPTDAFFLMTLVAVTRP